jgi:hypothetical protein
MWFAGFSAHRVLPGFCLAITFSFSVAGCADLLRQPSPIETASRATVPGAPEIRYMILTDPEPAREMLRKAYLEETEGSYDVLPDGTYVYNYLSVSGGGSDGAFGAGLLNGWTESGSRPKFKVVTGVSTGALIAPFAFLGPDYDATLKASYTTVGADRIFIVRSLFSLLWSESLTDTEPLKAMVANFIDQKVLDDVAVEHAKGRRLLVATTNLDAEQPVLWDMGAIASSKNPNRLNLFRTILVASASIPTVFPPVMLDVEIDGRHYDEMHVDGGVFFQSFSIASIINLPKAIKAAHPDLKGKVVQRLYVLRNGRITPDPKQVRRGLGVITLRAIGSMLKVSGINDLWRLYLSSLTDSIEFRFISIPIEYKATTDEQFNEAEMKREYAFGRELALKGIPWQRHPPGFDPE